MRKWRVVRRIHGMKYSWKGSKDKNRHKNRNKKEWASLVGLCQKYKLQHPHQAKASLRGLTITKSWCDNCIALTTVTHNWWQSTALRTIPQSSWHLTPCQDTDSSIHQDKQSKHHDECLNSQFDQRSPKALYLSFRKQHSCQLCLHYNGTWTTHWPV